MCMYETACTELQAYSGNRCSLLEIVPLTLDPCESQTCLCFQKEPPLLLLSVAWLGGGTAGEVELSAKDTESSQGVKHHLHLLLLLHPSRLLTFTPDPVTPSSVVQQQQKEEIREINGLEGITVGLFISGCTLS